LVEGLGKTYVELYSLGPLGNGKPEIIGVMHYWIWKVRWWMMVNCYKYLGGWKTSLLIIRALSPTLLSAKTNIWV